MQMAEKHILMQMDQILMRWASNWMGEEAALQHFANIATTEGVPASAPHRSTSGSVSSHIYGKFGVLYHMFIVLQLSKLKKLFTPTNPHVAQFWKKRKVILRDANIFDAREYMLYLGSVMHNPNPNPNPNPSKRDRSRGLALELTLTLTLNLTRTPTITITITLTLIIKP